MRDKEAECERLRDDLTEAKQKISTLVSVNEMLKLSLADLASALTLFQQQTTNLIGNVNTLRHKLPTINSRLSGTRTQDRDRSHKKPIEPPSGDNPDPNSPDPQSP